MSALAVEIERALIGVFLLSPDRIDEALKLGVSPDWFSDDASSLLYSAIITAHRISGPDNIQPLAILSEAQRIGLAPGERRDPAKLSAALVEECIDALGYDRDVHSLVVKLRNAYFARQAKKRVLDSLAEIGNWADVRDPLRDLRGKLDALISKAEATDARAGDMSFYDLPDAPPENENPRALLGNGFLHKGHGMMVVSTSGAGKSVFSVQMVLHFALGRAFFGMRPLRPLKIGLIQAEDDAEEMSYFRANMRRAFTGDLGWSGAEFDEALRSVKITERFVGKTGAAFLEELRQWQHENRFDIIVVNPLFSYFGGDLSNGHDVAEFFREGLDPMIKNPDTGFAIVFIHHATKPPKDAESRKGWGADAFAQYIGAGSTDVAGWSRASLIIMPISGHYGWARLIAAKRGGRLGWTDANGNSVQEKIITHGRDGGVYWREPDAAEIPDDVRKAVAVDAKPGEIGEEEARQRMLAHLRVRPMKTTPFFDWCKTQFKGLTSQKEVPAKRAYYSIVNNPAKWGLEKVKVSGGAYLLRPQGALTGADGAPIAGGGSPAAGSGAANVARPRVGDYDFVPMDGGGADDPGGDDPESPIADMDAHDD